MERLTPIAKAVLRKNRNRILGAIEERVKSQRLVAYGDLSLEDADISPSGRIPSVTERGIAKQPCGGIAWKARTLRTGRGIAAEEKRHGADLMGILDLALPDYRATKGFLAQAKRAEPSQRFSKPDWDRLRLQCETMLRRTPDSFVWVYSKSKGIRIFSANSVLGLESRSIFDLYSRGVSSFFENHIECFIGDGRLDSTNIETLDALDELPVERIFELSAKLPE